MRPSDLDVYRTAKVLLDKYGDDAPGEVAKRADDMLSKGDLDGVLVWRRVAHAVRELTRTHGGEPAN